MARPPTIQGIRGHHHNSGAAPKPQRRGWGVWGAVWGACHVLLLCGGGGVCGEDQGGTSAGWARGCGLVWLVLGRWAGGCCCGTVRAVLH